MATRFERRLSKSEERAKAALEYLKKRPAWWQNVLKARYNDRPLLIAVRDGYLNAYADGQSVLKIRFRADGAGVRPRCELHRKYVCGPNVENGYEVVDMRDLENPGTLKGWITEALNYADAEKRGVAAIAARHPNIIDVEMGLPANEPVEPGAKKTAPRMDIVALEKGGEGLKIVFYEAKLFDNGSLRSRSKPKILEQLKRYENWIGSKGRRDQVIEAYRRACRLLIEVDKMRGAKSHPCVVQAAEDGSKLQVDAKPRIIVFGCTKDQIGSNSSWKEGKHQEKLDRYELLMCERAEDVRLPSGCDEPDAT